MRRLRWEQRQEEAEPALLVSPGAGDAEAGPCQELQDRDNFDATENWIEILPPYTALNKVIAETGS